MQLLRGVSDGGRNVDGGAAPTRGLDDGLDDLHRPQGVGERGAGRQRFGDARDLADALAVLDNKAPVITVGRRIADTALDVVRTADDDGVSQTVDHLVGLGHREIVYVDGGKGVIATDRRRGYRTAMRRHGLGDHIRVLAGDNTEAAGERAARHLLDGGRLPTAVVAYNDQCAIGILAALARAGVAVPGEVSVAGYDDDTLSRLSCFNLTTVSQSAREQAQHAVTAAVERLDQDRTEPREVVLTPRLVVRGTTAGRG